MRLASRLEGAADPRNDSPSIYSAGQIHHEKAPGRGGSEIEEEFLAIVIDILNGGND
jgi:hypothetical protein